ncbi:MAG: hypothetical protein AUJ74_06240 [Candidatus Omnitrophica bacterium CG1_02_44_16]|nr:MAG: hypothetical protein AUJ74_06240 [Candidatus Omnitrophica bacterium CG1_02_44_16]PIY83031.1 MAG: hypothetical protein COY78_03580 [Candidatus Omnitrophica bacterium CG_4_10_14_0_8_um_filter_44_12]PIZ83600.1 MAG: hypothetical protein COX96_07415 [Candidatus Omnitrophica bacterium CG_4_10_14_0_2_um_filter_44_9]
MIKNKRILITGATGFIGANLARLFLKKGAQISVLLRHASIAWRIKDIIKDIDKYSVDLLERKNLQRIIKRIRPEIIFHTAVYGGYFFQNDPRKILETNFMGSVNLIEACQGVDFKLFVNTSSSSEYGIKDSPMRENDLLEPSNDYGSSKACATLFAYSRAKKEGLPLVTLRLFSPYGYYDDPSRLIPSVILSCLKGKAPCVSKPDNVRDFIFINDILDLYELLLKYKNKVGAKIFNVGSGSQYTVAEVVNKIIKLTGGKVSPKWGAIVNSRTEPDFWQADITKAKRELNWAPKTNLSHGLEKTIHWFQNNKHLYENVNKSLRLYH